MYYTINIFSHVFLLFDYSNFDIGMFAKKMFGKLNKWWTQISSVGGWKIFFKKMTSAGGCVYLALKSKRQSCHYIEVSERICRAYQLFGFYMMTALAYNELSTSERVNFYSW